MAQRTRKPESRFLAPASNSSTWILSFSASSSSGSPPPRTAPPNKRRTRPRGSPCTTLSCAGAPSSPPHRPARRGNTNTTTGARLEIPGGVVTRGGRSAQFFDLFVDVTPVIYQRLKAISKRGEAGQVGEGCQRVDLKVEVGQPPGPVGYQVRRGEPIPEKLKALPNKVMEGRSIGVLALGSGQEAQTQRPQNVRVAHFRGFPEAL